jgi:tetratricopeptide (TPR) repeat protein
MGRYDDAERVLQEALALQVELRTEASTNAARMLNALGDTSMRRGAPERAERFYVRARAAHTTVHGADHPYVAFSVGKLAAALWAQGRREEALATWERAIEIYDTHEGFQDFEDETRFDFARALVASGGDRARARREAELARARFEELGEARRENLEALDAWMTRELD